MSMGCEIHVKLATDQNLRLMKAAGCHTIQLGVESGNNEMLRRVRKNITIEEAFAAADRIRRHGIRLEVFFMVGFPEETEQTLQDTIDAMRAIKCDAVWYSIFTPYPGSELFADCQEHGVVDASFDASLYNHQSPESCFCRHIPKARFRERLAEVERMLDQRRAAARRSNLLRIRGRLWRVRELGLAGSIKRGIRAVLGA